MSISHRTLEEDEAKIDNLLHKVLAANEKISQLVHQVKIKSEDPDVLENVRHLMILTETIENLVMLADEIDVDDERLLENGAREQLQKAILSIQEAGEFLSHQG